MRKLLANKLIVYPNMHLSDSSQLALVLNPYILHDAERTIPHVPIFLFDYKIHHRESPDNPWSVLIKSHSGFADLTHPLLHKFNLSEIEPYFKWSATNYAQPPNYFDNAQHYIGCNPSKSYEEVCPVNLDAFKRTIHWGTTFYDTPEREEELQSFFDIAVKGRDSFLKKQDIWEMVLPLLKQRLPWVMNTFFVDMAMLFPPEFSTEDFMTVSFMWKERWSEYVYYQA